MERVKLIWDFRGPNALQTAKHHVVHLKEFAEIEGLQHTLCDIEEQSPAQCLAYLVVEKKHMNDLRSRLKPHKGQLYQE